MIVTPPSSHRVYLRPKSPKELSDFAILSEIVRVKMLPDGHCGSRAILGRF